jgi:uncharacterized protein YdhG (YjbR/CyaY superfamily)
VEKTGSTSVDEYIAAQPEAVQEALESVRAAIRTAVPDAEETISYKIPTYKLHGNVILYFAAWKHHYSVYPANDRVIAAFKHDLAAHDVNKSTIRFRFSEPVPVRLIERIATFRAQDVSERR